MSTLELETRVEGTKVVQSKGRHLVAVDLRVRGRAKLGGLAKQLSLQPEAVFQAILSIDQNKAAVRQLWEDESAYFDEYEGKEDPPFPGLSEARRQLRQYGLEFAAWEPGEPFHDTAHAYAGWELDPDRAPVVLLPLSEGFARLLDQVAGGRKRDARVKALDPKVPPILEDLKELDQEARFLYKNLKNIQLATKRCAKAIAPLHSLDMMLGCMRAAPKRGEDPSANDDYLAGLLQGRLHTLIDEATKHVLVRRPSLEFLYSKYDAEADALLEHLERPAFLANLKTLIANRDIVGEAVWNRAQDALRNTYTALSVSKRARHVFEVHLREAVKILAGRDLDFEGVDTGNEELDALLKDGSAFPKQLDDPTTALGVMAGAAGIVLSVGPNTPGPSSLIVAVMQRYSLQFTRELVAAQQAGKGVKEVATLFRSLTAAAGLSREASSEAWAAMRTGDLSKISRVTKNDSALTSSGWAGLAALLSIFVIVLAIKDWDSEAHILQKTSTVLNTLGAATTATLGIAVVINNLKALEQSGVLGKLFGHLAGDVGTRIGGIAAMIAIFANLYAAMEAYRRYDTEGVVVNLIGAGGAALTFAGWLIVGGASTTEFAGLGLILMAIGAAIAAGLTIYSYVKQKLTSGTELLFPAYIKAFEEHVDVRTAIDAPQAASLKAALEAVNDWPKDYKWPLWKIDESQVPQLLEVGFAVDHIMLMIDTDDMQKVTRKATRAGQLWWTTDRDRMTEAEKEAAKAEEERREKEEDERQRAEDDKEIIDPYR